MLKKLTISFIILFSTNVYSNDNLLTIQQQLERLQREVSDISKSVFSNDKVVIENDDKLANNLSSIDMRIYDLEKDVKKINADLEEILFQIDDLIKVINNFEYEISNINNNLLASKNQNTEDISLNDQNQNNLEKEENSLGSLKISTDNQTETSLSNVEINNDEEEETNLSPEDQFQKAFDNIRKKKWETAKSSLNDFIKKNPDNQLSGSAHYWLGELHILEKNYNDAVFTFAEGYQKFPKSIKAPDMLFKLSISLLEVNKNTEACKTMELLVKEFPKTKLINKTNKLILENDCVTVNQ